MPQTTLIVGGTGMLLECSRRLSQQSSLCLLPNRHPETFTDVNQTIHSFYGDWAQANQFFGVCEKHLRGQQVDLLVWWCHRPYAAPLASLISALLAPDCTVVEVIGSSDLRELSEAENRRLFPASCLAVLGRGQTGWLTHKEISQGVLEVVETGKSSVIGQL